MKIGIPKEIALDEFRVAAVPDTVAKMKAAGMEIFIEAGAGEKSNISDEAYRAAGASIVSTAELYQQADVIIRINPPTENEIKLFRENTILIAPVSRNPDVITQLKAKNVTIFSVDLIPRVARAQSMDILSSMSNLAGYKAVVLAADHLDKIFPMLTTAAGTIPPAKVIVIGAGVAGLQAIATVRRLGGVVIAFDTRPIVEEQVKSLGAEFVSLETKHEQTEDAGGYAKEQSAAFYQQEQNIIHQYSKNTDVIITTALIPGKRAPLLITEEMVKEMRPGSVIVDLAAAQEGNCALTEPGKIVTKHGVTIIGLLNLPSLLAGNASQLYAKNMLAFLNYIAPQLATKQFDLQDDIVKSALL